MSKPRFRPTPTHTEPAATAVAISGWRRIGNAFPDAVTAGMFLFAWVAPLAIEGLVRNLALVMIVEFLLIHASGFYTAFALMRMFDRRTTIAILIVLTGFYLLFIVVWSLIFGEWWPLLIFGWLVVGKMRMLRTATDERHSPMFTTMAIWAACVVLYLLAVIVGVLIPVPQLGISAEIVPLLDMKGEGEWLERPQTVLASGLLYFSLLAFSKFRWLPD